MNFTSLKSLFLIAFFAISIIACNKKNDEPAPTPQEAETGTLKIEFDNIAGSSDLVLGASYNNTNTANQTLSPNLLQYFISNIKLKKSDGTIYTVPQDNSYFLIKEDNLASQTLSLPNVPAGDYTELTFTVGVDSLRSTMASDKRLGALDIFGAAQGMYWSWNSGYIFFKMEGTSPQAVTQSNTTGAFKYHIGGFGGMTSAGTNNIRTRTVNLGGDKAIVRKDKTPQIHITVDILKALNGTTNINIATNSTIMSGALSTSIANNYVNMFEFDHVHN